MKTYAMYYGWGGGYGGAVFAGLERYSSDEEANEALWQLALNNYTTDLWRELEILYEEEEYENGSDDDRWKMELELIDQWWAGYYEVVPDDSKEEDFY